VGKLRERDSGRPAGGGSERAGGKAERERKVEPGKKEKKKMQGKGG